MDRHPFGNNIIASAGYDAQRAVLEIEFAKNAQIWQYEDVAEDLWYRMKTDLYPEEFFGYYIRGQHREVRLH